MKTISLRTVALAAPLVGLAAMIGCGVSDTQTPPGTAGSSSTGGSTGTAGTAPGTAGSITGTAGSSPSTAGSTSTAGAGGTTGTAGTTAGGTTGTAGTTAGGTTGTAGTGTAGTAGTAPVVTVDAILSGMSDFGNAGWKDSWWVTGCNVKNGHDCVTVPDAQCHSTDDAAGGSEGKGARTIEKFPVGGVAGQHYKVTFSFNAVTEAKKYDGGKRDVTGVAADVESGISDTFYRDGNSPASNYNVIKMTVFDDKNMPVRHFYMNSFPDTSYESHRTFLASYKKVIVIVGGGHVEHLVQDSNCHAIDNCGAGNVSDTECNGARGLPGGDNALMLPAKYKDPKDGTIKNTPLVAPGIPGASLAQPWHAQAGHLKVTAIELTNDPVTMDYPNP